MTTKTIIQTFVIIGILIAINVIGSYYYTQIDLTEEKKYTLTQPTRELIDGLKDVVYVKVLLEGEFPAGFKRLQTSVEEMLSKFRSISPYIEYQFENPSRGSQEEINARREELSKDGIFPINLRIMESGEKTDKLIYPYAIFNFGSRQVAVNLLENDVPGAPDEAVLNNSISLLEYKFANAIEKLFMPKQPVIGFLEGHGELSELETADLRRQLQPYYTIGRMNLDSTYGVPEAVHLLVVAKPTRPFPEKHKFFLDQYIMRGGKVLWLIDPLNVSLDSLRNRSTYVPFPYDLNIDDQLFNYGVRLENNLVLDLESSKIPLATGQVGNAPQLSLFDWYYHLTVAPKSNHPIVKGLDRINLFFPSGVDTIETETEVEKTILLRSSQYSRFQMPPVRLNFDILRYEPDPEKFNVPNIPLAVLLEGTFPSHYKNRVSSQMQAGLEQMDREFLETSVENRMILVADGDVARNTVDRSGQPRVLGYNIFDRYTYANKDFLVNCIEYLLDDDGVIQARTREVKLRLLDRVKIREESTKWQLINILVPLFIIGLFGILFNYLRKRKYAH